MIGTFTFCNEEFCIYTVELVQQVAGLPVCGDVRRVEHSTRLTRPAEERPVISVLPSYHFQSGTRSHSNPLIVQSIKLTRFHRSRSGKCKASRQGTHPGPLSYAIPAGGVWERGRRMPCRWSSAGRVGPRVSWRSLVAAGRSATWWPAWTWRLATFSLVAGRPAEKLPSGGLP